MRGIPNFNEAKAAAAAWASRLHEAKGQRYGEHPHAVHLEAVEMVLIRFGFGNPADPIHQVLRVAAWSHDLLEDAGDMVSEDTIRVLQGVEVAAIVRALTNPPGPNRAARAAAAYPRIKANPLAIVVKLADRISNVEAAIKANNRFLAIYREEHPGFRSALYEPDGMAEAMWQHLDALITLVPAPEPVAPQPIQKSLFELEG